MKILVTGKYEPEYNRNQVLLRGLKSIGVEIIESPYLKRDRFAKEKILLLEKDCDLIFLPSFTHLDVPFVRRLSRKPLVFDPLISRYLSKVFDYKAVWRFSPRALKNYLKDLRAFKRSDLILADTDAHKDYYIRKFGIAREKIAVVRVGVCTADFFPTENTLKPAGKTIVGFYGSFIPLHGLDRIIASAKILEHRDDLEYRIYGDGPGFSKITELIEKLALKNTILKGWTDYGALNEVINEMDICLGIFGESLKAELVIPNKIYHYAACRKPIITNDTIGIKEIFTNGINIALTKNDPVSMAKTIESIADNRVFRSMLGSKAYELVTINFNEIMIAQEFMEGIGKIS